MPSEWLGRYMGLGLESWQIRIDTGLALDIARDANVVL